VRWRSFVAMGDSFTEGLDDRYDDGRYRGWADLVAHRLAGDAPGFRYANLAIRGRLFDDIVTAQVPEALQMRPDLVSFSGGGNDALRRGFQAGPMLERYDRVVGQLRATGADVVLFRFADLSRHLPGRRYLQPRIQVLNEAVGPVAARHGAVAVDLWADEAFANPLLWSEDRLHLSSAGHRRVAALVLRGLGLEPDADWLAEPAAPRRRTWVVARAHDARWVRQHLAPWVVRRITGRSSGDTIAAKRPALDPLDHAS
jgi:lysophospholipase L1-like esterase